MRLSATPSASGAAIYYRRSASGLKRLEARGADKILREVSFNARRIARPDGHIGTTNIIATLSVVREKKPLLKLNALMCPTDKIVTVMMTSFEADDAATPRANASWVFDLRDSRATEEILVQQVVTANGETKVSEQRLQNRFGRWHSGDGIASTIQEHFREPFADVSEFAPFIKRFNAIGRTLPGALGPRSLPVPLSRKSESKDLFKDLAKGLVSMGLGILQASIGGGLIPGGIVGDVFSFVEGLIDNAIDYLADLIFGKDEPSKPSDATTKSPDPDDPAPSGDNTDDNQGGDSDGGGGDEGGGGGGCVVPGTLVATPSGYQPIEHLSIGDSVLSFDQQHETSVPRSILNTFTYKAREVIMLVFQDEEIMCTPAHRFYTGRWQEAGSLQAGDKVLSSAGRWEELLSVNRNGARSDVFNLHVADHHTYFVGDRQLLVHNTKKSDADDDGPYEDDP